MLGIDTLTMCSSCNNRQWDRIPLSWWGNSARNQWKRVLGRILWRNSQYGFKQRSFLGTGIFFINSKPIRMLKINVAKFYIGSLERIVPGEGLNFCKTLFYHNCCCATWWLLRQSVVMLIRLMIDIVVDLIPIRSRNLLLPWNTK